jgi:hypothetical protein
MSSKIELIRESKAPVKLENYKLYQDDWIKFFDAVMAKYALDMEKIHVVLERGEKRLNRKYSGKVEIEFPLSEESLTALCEEYKVPIMFAQRMDGKGLVAVIMDNYVGT